jgi:hypothetical protein
VAQTVMDFMQDVIHQGQTAITLLTSALLTLGNWILLMCRGRDPESNRLLMFGLNVGGAITGLYIFVGAFALMKKSPQDGFYSGLAGFVVFLITAQNLFREIRQLCVRQVNPEKTSRKRKGASTSE